MLFHGIAKLSHGFGEIKEMLAEKRLPQILWIGVPLTKITVKGLAEKLNKISQMMTDDAKERYLQFLAKFPNLLNRIPLSHLASYLGTTQQSLSRIRKNIR